MMNEEPIEISPETVKMAKSAVWKEYRRLSKDATVDRETVKEWRHAVEELTEAIQSKG